MEGFVRDFDQTSRHFEDFGPTTIFFLFWWDYVHLIFCKKNALTWRDVGAKDHTLTTIVSYEGRGTKGKGTEVYFLEKIGNWSKDRR